VTATEIQTRFGIPGVLRWEETPGGLTRGVIAGPEADAVVYLHGAHVTAWTPAGHEPVLFTSSRSRFEPGVPIRGGVPVVFPWFGPRSGAPGAPLHGFARIIEWDLESARLRPDGSVEVSMTAGPTDASRALGFDAFQLRFRVSAGAALAMELEVRNESQSPLHFEEALHTYFSVGDITSVSVHGLEGTICVDKTDGFTRKQVQGPVRIARETDQVHLNTTAACEIHDPVRQRVIAIEKDGSQTTVVWNPWIEKNRTIADMAPDDWRTMLCIETANALDNAIELPAGGVHRMRAAIRVG
jgi:glucose-6-phosphate 1-epimerase